MGILNEIGLKYDTDKSSRFHHYLDFYEEHFPDRDFDGRLLEIGVMDGFSMKTWREYYPKAEIIGIDIFNKDHLHNKPWAVPKSVQLLEMDGTDPVQLSTLGMFDIVIDDGSHLMSDQQNSFVHLYYNQLKPNGLYVIEDLWTSYIDSYQDAELTTIEYLTNLEQDGVDMIYFTYEHEDGGIQTVFPDYKGLASETVIIKRGE